MRLTAFFSILAAISLPSLCVADLFLPAIFSEHMVLQRSAATPVWGYASASEQVTLRLSANGTTLAQHTTTADDSGRWHIDLNLEDTTRFPAKPLELVIQASNTITIPDVLIGEVWLASGQSNMARRMQTSGSPEEIEASANNEIRFFTVSNKASQSPLPDISGKWVVASPKTTGGFSAVAYYFARELQQELGIPLGIIHASWGGSPVEAWTSFDALVSSPEITPAALAAIREFNTFPQTKADWLTRLRPWLAANQREDIPTAEADLPAYTTLPAVAGTDGWSTVKLPATLPGERIFWVRRNVVVPASASGKPLVIDIDEIAGIDAVYFSGKHVGGRTLETFGGNGRSRLDTRRRYTIPAAEVTAGTHTLAIRIYAPLGQSGISGGYFSLGSQSLVGDWLTKTELAFAPLDSAAASDQPEMLKPPLRPWNVPASLYNGMIHALAPYGLRGFIWYQGENDAGNPARYHTSFPLLIEDWRTRWAENSAAGSAPHAFYWCQLPNFQSPPTDPNGSSGWAAIREAQSSALSLPHTGQAVLIDAGEGGDIHPQSKREAGARLAALALAHDYGRQVAYSGPVYDTMSIDGSSIRIRFRHTGSGLVAQPVPTEQLWQSVPKPVWKPVIRNSPDSQLEGFMIRAADGKWHWANAHIDGDTVVVSSPAVPNPEYVRYAWFSNPICNLYNTEGLPAAPFRTDSD